jgi:hypothetical protein
MPKCYYPTPDELQGATPLNDLVWFERHQNLLVKLANTDWGRDLLLIDKHPYPVVAIKKHCVRFHLGVWDDQDHYLSDFRIGAKWGNIIRYRWLAVKEAIDHMILLSVLESWHPIYDRQGELLLPVGGGTTTIAYPEPDTESNTVDGMVAKDDSGSMTWDTVHDASSGDNAYDSQATRNQRVRMSSTDNQFIEIDRSFTLFLTSDIGSADTINSATLGLVTNATYTGFSDSITMVETNPSSSTALATGDYALARSQVSDAKQAADVAVTSFSADDATYDNFTLNATGLGNISKTGISKFGFKNLTDFSDSEPTSVSGAVSAGIIWYCADYTGTSRDPKLTVIHSGPFTPRAMIF